MRTSTTSTALVAAARELSAQVGRMRFAPPVAHVYNPLDYAWAAHEKYLRKFGGDKKRVIFLGMNPGPFGMAQTGVPFGEIAAARDWLKVTAPVARPRHEHPKRPVLGFDCVRSEVSGKRLWGLFADRFGTAKKFSAQHFVTNYCPLAFLSPTGSNLTPDKLPVAEREKLFAACDTHLRRVLEILEPEWLIGIGAFALGRGEIAGGVKLGKILHPSPASPAANRGWAEAATQQLHALGVW